MEAIDGHSEPDLCHWPKPTPSTSPSPSSSRAGEVCSDALMLSGSNAGESYADSFRSRSVMSLTASLASQKTNLETDDVLSGVGSTMDQSLHRLRGAYDRAVLALEGTLEGEDGLCDIQPLTTQSLQAQVTALSREVARIQKDLGIMWKEIDTVRMSSTARLTETSRHAAMHTDFSKESMALTQQMTDLHGRLNKKVELQSNTIKNVIADITSLQAGLQKEEAMTQKALVVFADGLRVEGEKRQAFENELRQVTQDIRNLQQEIQQNQQDFQDLSQTTILPSRLDEIAEDVKQLQEEVQQIGQDSSQTTILSNGLEEVHEKHCAAEAEKTEAWVCELQQVVHILDEVQQSGQDSKKHTSMLSNRIDEISTVTTELRQNQTSEARKNEAFVGQLSAVVEDVSRLHQGILQSSLDAKKSATLAGRLDALSMATVELKECRYSDVGKYEEFARELRDSNQARHTELQESLLASLQVVDDVTRLCHNLECSVEDQAAAQFALSEREEEIRKEMTAKTPGGDEADLRLDLVALREDLRWEARRREAGEQEAQERAGAWDVELLRSMELSRSVESELQRYSSAIDASVSGAALAANQRELEETFRHELKCIGLQCELGRASLQSLISEKEAQINELITNVQYLLEFEQEIREKGFLESAQPEGATQTIRELRSLLESPAGVKARPTVQGRRNVSSDNVN